MRKIALNLLTAAGLVLPSVASATCTINDKPCPPGYEPAITAGIIAVWGVVMLLIIGFFIFWLLMLLDCLKRQWPEKNTWLVILVVGFFLGFYWLAAILYYLLIKSKHVGTLPGETPTVPQPPAPPAPPTA